MPIVIKCRNCGHEFYRGYDAVEIINVLSRNSFTCPKCGRRIDVSKLYAELNVDVRVLKS